MIRYDEHADFQLMHRVGIVVDYERKAASLAMMAALLAACRSVISSKCLANAISTSRIQDET
jgi:hypothetical protein